MASCNSTFVHIVDSVLLRASLLFESPPIDFVLGHGNFDV